MKVWAHSRIRASYDRIFLNKGVINAATERKSDGSITITIENQRPDSLSENIAYDLYIHLTEDEIAKLFLECFPQMRDVIARVVPPPPSGVNVS